jgi:hypothetical protein
VVGGEPPLAYRFEVVQGMNLRLGDGVYFVVLYKVLQGVFRTLRSATFFLFRKKEGKMRPLGVVPEIFAFDAKICYTKS